MIRVNRNTGFNWWCVVIKIAAWLSLPAFFVLVAAYAVVNLLIDLFAAFRESKVLSDRRAKEKAIDRRAERWHNLANLCMDYLKKLFL